MPVPVMAKPTWTPTEAGGVFTAVMVVLPLAVVPVSEASEKDEKSNQPKLTPPPGKPGWATRTRVPTTSIIGGVQSPVVRGETGVLADVTLPTVMKVPALVS